MRSGATHLGLGEYQFADEDDSLLRAYGNAFVRAGRAQAVQFSWDSSGKPYLRLLYKDGTESESYSVERGGFRFSPEVVDAHGLRPPPPPMGAVAKFNYIVKALNEPPEPKPPPPPGEKVMVPSKKTDGSEPSSGFKFTEDGSGGSVPTFLSSAGWPDWSILKWAAIFVVIGVGLYAVDFATKD